MYDLQDKFEEEAIVENADMEENLWKIQEYGTTWKDKGLYHVTITIPDRQRILGNLIIPNDDPQ